MAIVGLDHVQVAAPPGCEEAAREFYGRLLDMPEIVKPPELAKRGGVWFAAGAQQLHVGVEEKFSPARKAHPALSVDDIDALAQRLRAAGQRVDRDESVPSTRRFFTSDPWGNRVELVANSSK